MQVGQAQVVRSNWYDRSLITRSFALASPLTAHGYTIQKTYTVPVNKVAMVSIMPHSMRRYSIGAGPNECAMILRFTPSGGALGDIVHLITTLANVDDRIGESGHNQIMLSAGDQLELATLDSSSGGTIVFSGGFMVTEYAV